MREDKDQVPLAFHATCGKEGSLEMRVQRGLISRYIAQVTLSMLFHVPVHIHVTYVECYVQIANVHVVV